MLKMLNQRAYPLSVCTLTHVFKRKKEQMAVAERN